MNKNEKAFSKNIEEFLNFISYMQKEHDYCFRNIDLCNKATTDLLHELELGETKNRSKASTKLANARKARRLFKDYYEISDPIFQWVLKNQKFLEELKKILGETRKQEKIKIYRNYNPRILDKLDFLEKREKEKEKNDI